MTRPGLYRLSPFLVLVILLALTPNGPRLEAEGTSTSSTGEPSTRLGRPVRILSLSFQGKTREQVLALVDREAASGADLMILPETWLGQRESPETLEGPTITSISALARKHHAYVVCPIDRRDGSRRLNSAVLLNREGQVQGVYDKVYPYWSEFDLKEPVSMGSATPVFPTDFGKLGLAICFDVNFPEVWQKLADQGAEIVVWPSAYSAGTSLQAHALNHGCNSRYRVGRSWGGGKNKLT